MCLETMVMMIENGHVMNKTNLKVQTMLSFQFVGGSTILHWEGHTSFVQSEFEVHEHLMESLFHELSNGSGLTTRSSRQGLQTITTSCHCFCQKLYCRRGLDIHPWDPGPSWSTLQSCGEHLRDAQGRPPPCHHLRRQAKASKPSWKPNPCEVRVHRGLQEQSVVKRTPRLHTDFVFNETHMDGRII